MSSRVIAFNSKVKLQNKDQTDSFNKLSYLQFNNYDLNCIIESLLYLSGIVEPRSIGEVDESRKKFTHDLYNRVKKESQKEISRFYFSSEEILCLSESLLMYSSFLGSQEDEQGNNNVKKSYILQLYSIVSDYIEE